MSGASNHVGGASGLVDWFVGEREDFGDTRVEQFALALGTARLTDSAAALSPVKLITGRRSRCCCFYAFYDLQVDSRC